MLDNTMIRSKSESKNQADVRLGDLDESSLDEIFQAYSLLQSAMGVESVEDIQSFRRTLSSRADRHVMPRAVCAFGENQLSGIIVGMTLTNLQAGFIAYSAVQESSRRRGIYATMRNDLLRRFRDDGVEYVVSELDPQDWLYKKYINNWNAVDLPIYYEQPAAQGLQAKPLSLVAQPIEGGTTPNATETAALISEIYQRVYGISDVENCESFRKVLASLTTHD